MIPEIDFLRKIYIFQDLVDQELEFIAQIMTPREFPSGELVIEEGKQGDSMYVIAEGEVQVFKSLTMKFGEDDFRETEKTLITLRAEDHVVIGEMSLITEAERSATVTAQIDSTLYEITREHFLNLAWAKPELGLKVTLRLAELVSQRLKKSGEDVIRLTTALSIALSQ
ncbi:MAG: cyclic nucleotide-binding domain-containing protein [Proteobacteria bacterium]|nr:cyclic nucleotide-binding domain-containing protein [Pseudomonadota bacterium]